VSITKAGMSPPVAVSLAASPPRIASRRKMVWRSILPEHVGFEGDVHIDPGAGER